MKKTNGAGILGWVIVILGGIASAIGSAILTVDTSQKVLGDFVDETEEEIRKLEEGDDEDIDDGEDDD